MPQDWWVGQGEDIDVHALNIVPPISVPEPQEITLKINVGVTSRVRQWDEPFKPTISYTSPFLYITNLLDYSSLIPVVASNIWSYVESEKAAGAIVETHCQVWLDNATHAPTAAGVVKLPKGSRDTQLSSEEFTSAKVLEDHLTGNVLDIKNTAKY